MKLHLATDIDCDQELIESNCAVASAYLEQRSEVYGVRKKKKKTRRRLFFSPLPRYQQCREGCVCGKTAAWCSCWQRRCSCQEPCLPLTSPPSPGSAQRNTASGEENTTKHHISRQDECCERKDDGWRRLLVISFLLDSIRVRVNSFPKSIGMGKHTNK